MDVHKSSRSPALAAPATTRHDITSIDVARLAEVSQSAVSRTFTPGASVSPDTRSRVLEAARKLGYRPNATARTLATRLSRMIALVVSNLHFLSCEIRLLTGVNDVRWWHRGSP